MMRLSLLTIFTISCLGCQVGKIPYKMGLIQKKESTLTTETKEPKEKQAPLGAIEYEKTMARIAAERAAEHAKWKQPLTQNYSIYLFEVGSLKSKIWIYPDSRYAMGRPDSIKGTWKHYREIMTLSSYRGEQWVFKPLPSGTYESKSHENTYLIPIQK